ncbi:Guanine nucleotide-binding protein, beta subunit [Trema orientale]|uniref:Guanine nucleotide-binding protein, beta subunit n=1 Tax=Trema orientale TaxID=63057 RepID=A0A2P5EW95_TREOI|nr:Guanine nucleotide-binding protein, beta subunit [Trema orientale]
MDYDYAHYMVTQSWKLQPKNSSALFGESYQELLALALNQNHNRIMVYHDKKPQPLDLFNEANISSLPQFRSKTSSRGNRIPSEAERVLDAPGLLDNDSLNLLDWSTRDVIAIALWNSVFCLNNVDSSVWELLTVNAECGPVTSLSWAPDGKDLAIGLRNSVQLWDILTSRKIRSLSCSHYSTVGSMAWNRHVITTGGKDGKIVNNDIRSKSNIVDIYQGHRRDVCGLNWSNEGSHLASGGRDRFLHVWDRHMASPCLKMQHLHRIRDHKAAVRALAWSPHRRNLLASGGGKGDHCIKIWNSQLGQCLNSVNTGSEVCALLWNKHENELLSSHGSSENQLILWKYPSMMKISKVEVHSSRVLFMAQSPNGCKVASAAPDDSLRLWNIFPLRESDSSIQVLSSLFSHTIR